MDSYPHPEADWPGFVAAITAANLKVPKVWNPITKKMDVWVDVAHLKSAYHKGGGCLIA